MIKKALLIAFCLLFLSSPAFAQIKTPAAIVFSSSASSSAAIPFISSANGFVSPPTTGLATPASQTKTIAALLPAQSAMPAAGADQASDIVGTVIQIEGSAEAASGLSNDRSIALNDNAPIHLHDVIKTGPSTHLLLVLIDNTQVTLGENSAFSVDDYQFDPDAPAGNRARYSFATGIFQYVSGQVAKIENPDVRLETAYGEIGIRGTTVWGGPLEDQYGVFVQEGMVTLTTHRGRLLVGEGQGTSVKDIDSVPEHAAPWAPGRIQSIIQSVRLKNAQQAAARIALLRPSQPLMISRYKAMMAARRSDPETVHASRHDPIGAKPLRMPEKSLAPLPAIPQVMPIPETKDADHPAEIKQRMEERRVRRQSRVETSAQAGATAGGQAPKTEQKLRRHKWRRDHQGAVQNPN